MIFIALCLAAGGCVLMPPMPYGRTLLVGQGRSNSGIDGAFHGDRIKSASKIQGGSTTESSTVPVQMTWYPIFFHIGSSHGLTQIGTEWGWQFTLISLEPALYLRQSLLRPVDPYATALALQADAVYGLSEYSCVSLALAATKRFSDATEGTLAVRGGRTAYPLFGPSTGWGPSTYGTVQTQFVDFAGSIGFGRNNENFILEAVLRLPLDGTVNLSSSTYTRPYPPFTTTTYTQDAELGPTFFTALRWSLPDFTAYAGQYLAVPRHWTPRNSAEELSTRGHMALGLKLANANMPADAADEFQQVLREEPDQVEPLARLAEIYIVLQEPEMALYCAQRALQLEPDNAKAAKALRGAQELLMRNP